MSGVRVCHGTLRLRAPDTRRAEAAKLKAVTQDKLLRPVLARLGDRLATHLGHAVEIEVRDIRLRLRMKLSELGSDAMMMTVVDDLADYVLSQGQKPKRHNPAAVFNAPVRIFNSAEQKRAVELIAAVDRSKDANGRRRDVATLWRRLNSQGTQMLTACLAECAAFARLDTVAEQLSLEDLIEVMPQIHASANQDVESVMRTVLAAKQARRSGDQTTTESHAGPTQTSPSCADEDQADTKASTTSASNTSTPEIRNVPRQEPPVANRQSAVPEPDETSPSRVAQKRVPPAEPVATGSELASQAERRTTEVEREERENLHPQHPMTSIGAFPLVVQSNWCGLLYLVNIAQRISMPEIFWRVGVSEGDALREALMAISGEADTATDCLSPSFPNTPEPIPPQPDWARQELNTELEARMSAETTRRAAAIVSSLQTEPGWELASSGASALLALAEEALGQTLDQDDWNRIFGLPGRIVVDEAEITVFQEIDAIDLEVRRAGLDANPGWLPWLDKTLTFVFLEDEAAS